MEANYNAVLSGDNVILTLPGCDRIRLSWAEGHHTVHGRDELLRVGERIAELVEENDWLCEGESG